MGKISPKKESDTFKCSYCKAVSLNRKKYICIRNEDFKEYEGFEDVFDPDEVKTKITIGQCVSCKGYYIWKDEELIYPIKSEIDDPNEDMPENIMKLYNEAREVYPISKKSSAALLRLALQHLCIFLGEKGENINKDIASLVAKGLSEDVQKSLDLLRITGNKAVHPGELNLNEDDNLVSPLFFLLNFIIEKVITEPKKINEFYDRMPTRLKDKIKERDTKK